MNNTFLQHVAQDIVNKYDGRLHRIAVVFPNKRASLFLNQNIYELKNKTMWGPSYFSISELFCQHSGLLLADPIQLVCELYKSFKKYTETNETLDQFFGWGQVLLSDFDDIDKCMADASKIFQNLSDLHEYDDISYLAEEQKKMLKRFFGNFSESHNTILKERFLKIWSQLGHVYTDFKECLRKKGIGYEGMILRQVAEGEHLSFDFDEYLFVGFNVVQKAERFLFKRLKDEGKARFYWDYDTYYMPGKDAASLKINKPGSFIAQQLEDFPNELNSDDGSIYQQFEGKKDITIISSATENMQARYVGTWLEEHQLLKCDSHTAIVMCNEGILPTLLKQIPEDVESVNITSGYPLMQTPVSSFIQEAISLQTVGLVKDRYRLHYVYSILYHPLARHISDKCDMLIKDLRKNRRFYLKRQELIEMDKNLAVIFADLNQMGEEGKTYHPALAMASYLRTLLKQVGTGAKEHDAQQANALEHEAIYRAYTIINRLYGLMNDGELNIDTTTFQRLLNQIILGTNIPFHGEPAVGLQVMGVLETRNLDFEHLLILSCNEGNMPKGENDPSFIPHILRKAYGLTTTEHKTAIYAYYFYRMIQRAKDVTFLYCNATDDGHTGEMSRFMLQLLVEDPHHKIKRCSLQTKLHPMTHQPQEVAKDQSVMKVLSEKEYLSPTALGRYLRCPLQYFYQQIAGIRENDDKDMDDIDSQLFGSIFHDASEFLYLKMPDSKHITESDIDNKLKDEKIIQECVDMAFKKNLFKNESSSFKPEYNGLQLINRNVIVRFLKELLETDKKSTPFSIINLEHDVFGELDINGKKIKIGGRIDRLDEVTTSQGTMVRVIDYKTGRKQPGAMESVEDIFSPEKIDNHSDYYLQTMLYSMIVDEQMAQDADKTVSPMLLFIQHVKDTKYDPVLKINKQPVTDVKGYREEFITRLKALINEILDEKKKFSPTPYKDRCKSCIYRKMCY